MTQNTSRILSLNVLRGLTIALMILMILLNTPSSWDYGYPPPFRHTAWSGVTSIDFVFQLFLFIMGVSLAFYMNRLANTELTTAIFVKFLKRSLILLFIGIALNIIPNFEFATLHISGILQSIYLVFLINAVLFISTARKTQTFIEIVVLLLYWVLLTSVSFNGQIPSLLTPENNLSALVDNIILNRHMWSLTGTWDLARLLATLPTIISTSIGMLVGSYLKKYNFECSSMVKVFIYGLLILVVGLLLHQYFPMNKSLWTSTYVLFTSGIGIILFALLYLAIDKNSFVPPILFKPFKLFGTNAIVAFVLSGLVAILFHSIQTGDSFMQSHLYDSLATPLRNPYLASLVYVISFTSLIYLPVLLLNNNKVFIKI